MEHAEIEHGLLFEEVTVDKTRTRQGRQTVALRAHHRMSERTSSTTSLHLSMNAVLALHARLGEILVDMAQAHMEAHDEPSD